MSNSQDNRENPYDLIGNFYNQNNAPYGRYINLYKWKDLFNKENIFYVQNCKINTSRFTDKFMAYRYYNDLQILGDKRRKDLEQGIINVKDLRYMGQISQDLKRLEKRSNLPRNNPIDGMEF